jgi:hypothetical protein
MVPSAAAGGLNDGHHALNVLIGEELPDGMVRVTTKGFFVRDDHLNGGDYHDVVQRTDDGWRYVTRTYVPRWAVEVAGNRQLAG